MVREAADVVRCRFESVNAGDLVGAAEAIARNCVSHFPGAAAPLDRAAWMEVYAALRAAFPDLHVAIDDQIAGGPGGPDGDQVITRWTARGTHRGELQGLAPTGRQIALAGVSIDRFTGRRVVEHWEYFDQLEMLQQLGALPAPGQATSDLDGRASHPAYLPAPSPDTQTPRLTRIAAHVVEEAALFRSR